MSWHRIVLPFTTKIDPTVVKIGKLAWECYEKTNRPAGFAIFHATESQDGLNEKWVIYLSPVVASLCKQLAESYTLEPCDIPARDEPNIAFVFGDPLIMGELQESYQAKLAGSSA